MDLHLVDQLGQVGIALSPTAVWLSQQRHRPDRQRWASVVGLALQPAWYWMAYRADGWGLAFTAVVYTGLWGLGFWYYWLQPRWGAAL